MAQANAEELKFWVEQAQRGDLDAYDRIVRHLQDMAVGYAYSVIGDFHQAQDAAQEAFIEGFCCLPELREAAALTAWFRKIIFKHCDRITRRPRFSTAPMEDAWDVVCAQPGPAARLENEELKTHLKAAIACLPVAERVVTLLFYIGEHSQQEIGEFLELPVTTIKKRLQSARKKLKKRMITMVQDDLQEYRPSKSEQFARQIREMVGALQSNDAAAIERLSRENPDILHEKMEFGGRSKPMAGAAQLGNLGLVKQLRELGAQDLQQALSRACMFGHREVARFLVSEGADPDGIYGDDAVHYGPVILAPCECLNPDGLRLALELGANPNVKYQAPDGQINTPLGMVLQTYTRDAPKKHRCLEILIEAGVPCEESAVMAVHCGRLDWLEKQWEKNPDLVHQRLSYGEAYPARWGVNEASCCLLAPLQGVTLLHLSIEYDEFEIANWLLSHGADINARAEVEGNSQGHTPQGHTPLFHAVLACLSSTELRTRFLLERGANPSLRATISHPQGGWEGMIGKTFEAVSPLGYALSSALAFPFGDSPRWVNRDSIGVLREVGAPE